MRFVRRHRISPHGAAPGEDEDPLAGLANLFDVSVAFIVALLIALFQGSTWMTEVITLEKYGAPYAHYQATVSRLLPWFPATQPEVAAKKRR